MDDAAPNFQEKLQETNRDKAKNQQQAKKEKKT
jgi:hypothetical protein